MGSFFDDNKPNTAEQKVEPAPMGFFSALLLMFIAWVLTVLSWIFKPLLTWAFTFEGKTREQVTVQLVVIAILFGGTSFFIYKIPMIRDLVSLSNTHTINIVGNQGRILFPDRSYFVPAGNSKVLRFQELGDIIYITYSGYNENVAEKIGNNYCQLVPRAEKILLSSDFPPVRAEGFEDRVEYKIIVDGAHVPFYFSIMIHIANPSFLFNEEALKSHLYGIEKEATWKEFLDDWNLLQTISGTQSRWFKVKALSSEHAIVCF